MEGIMTVVLGILGYMLIVDFPDKVHLSKRPFLTVDELQLLKDRLQRDRGDSEFDKITLKIIGKVLLNWQIWA